MSFPQYSRAERNADAAVHIAGITGGVVGGFVLTFIAISRIDLGDVAGIGVYVFGLLAMLTCSALYNMTNDGTAKELFRRLDHAGIFLMIAGSYTPFALVAIGGNLGVGLLIYVWSVAGIGIVFKLIYSAQWQALSIAIYLLLGWTIIVVIDPLMAAVSSSCFALLAAGGVLYSTGVIFHTWTSLPYQNVIWHLFVLAGASCHFLAVLTEIAMV